MAGKTTWYIRNASGNVMNTYESGGVNEGALTQTEIHMYGSSRLGVYNVITNMQVNTSNLLIFTRGIKVFELSNHLGNVLDTISDKKLAVADPNNANLIAYYNADVVTASDYYPFGMTMPVRSFSVGGKYRYGFNGQEKSKEINDNSYTAEYWQYDARLGRRFNVDPKPTIGISDYATLFNNPIFYNDVHGDSPPPPLSSKYWYIGKIPEFKYNGNISDVPVENIPNALGNGVIKLLNIVPEMWNSGVANVQNLRQGTWTQQVSSELSAMGNGISNAAAYPFITPLSQQGKDLVSTLDNPNTLATGVSFWLGGEISAIKLPISKAAPKITKIESTFIGGAKGELLSKELILEANHVPSMKSYEIAGFNVPYNTGSAFQMLYKEHRAYITTGRSPAAVAFRNMEADLLKQGNYMEAFDLNVTRVRAEYGAKYDDALNGARTQYINNVIPFFK